MKYQVVLHRLARDDLDRAYLHVARYAPRTAARWIDRFEDSLQRLERHPQRCGAARENRKTAMDLREFHFGKRPYVFRVIFNIDDQFVRILRILRAQRRPLSSAEIEEASDWD
ncbi:MAG TPA: type II toxin-antitoxin system RelE/ParE family toxin [Pirellulales bacterium]|nr:type II toxin-antitoxin system RelE/ParE family toxin [Pirellulales bacterium]